MRRALARSCMIESALESSMKMGALENSSAVWTRRFCSSPFLESNPSRSSFMFTRAREHSIRSASCAALISSENTKLATPGPRGGSEAASAKLSASDVFPIEGRAARMIISWRWKPHISASRSLKPEDTPVSSPFFIIIFVMTFIASRVGSRICLALSLTRFCVTVKIRDSIWSTNSSIPPENP